MSKILFTSESVTEGHPDKACDAISDAILDDILSHDPNAHVACETLATKGVIVVSGEVRTNGFTEVEKIVNTFFKEIINALVNQRRIELRGFGSFFTKIRDKRVGFNPKNGQKIEIDKKIHPKFKMGKILFKKLNPK